MKKEKNLTSIYSMIQFSFWMNFAAIIGFASVYLLKQGFSNTEIGILIAAAGGISAILQPVLASYADRPSSPSLKRLILGWSGILLLMAGVLLAVRENRIATGLLYAGEITFLQLLTPLINSLGMESLNQGKKLNYGASRGMGSVAYCIASYVLGGAAARFGAAAIPAAMILGFGLLMIMLLVFPFQKTEVSKQQSVHKKEKENSGFGYFCKKYRRFCITLCGCVCIYIGHVLLNSFTFQIVESKGGGSPEMGTAMALAAVMELPTMFLFGVMIKRAGADVWLRISGIFFTVKILGTLLAPNVVSFYFVQIFQMLGWALITVASVYYVNSVMEEQDAIKGQAYMTMTYTLGSVIGALIGGTLIDAAGVTSMLLFALGSSLIGMVIVLCTAGRKK